jgi:N4-(beta-N-acetylglucosaminyl)-L-asparaginase
MSRKFSRRTFVAGGAAVGIGARVAHGQGAAVVASKAAAPVVIASANGHNYRNGGPRTCVEEAFLRLTRGDDVLDAVIAGVNIVELDPEDASVGYGGLPNADGIVQLDSCCMHGPKKRAGAVAAIEGVRTPSRVAQAVADTTDHHLLVGHGAQRFARSMGFEIEEDLNTEHSRARWLEWKRRTDPLHYLDPEERAIAMRRVGEEMMAEGLVDPEHYYGTINCNAVNAEGEVCGVTTTSGLAWKIPGRVGDSPILGAGLYVDGEVGAAGSTGRGEANLFSLASFLVVEQLRRGAHPRDAGMAALRRVTSYTVEERLLDSAGKPNFNLKFYVLDKIGRYAGVSMWLDDRQKYAICTERGPEILICESLHGERPAS